METKMTTEEDRFIKLVYKARQLCPDQNLWTILGNEIVTEMVSDNDIRFDIKSWLFQFKSKTIILPFKNIMEVKETEITSSKLISSPGPQGITPLERIRVGWDEATYIAKKNGGIITAGGGMMGSCVVMLNMRKIDDEIAPMWLMPHHISGFVIIGIRADTGKITFISDEANDTWTETMPKQIKQLLNMIK